MIRYTDKKRDATGEGREGCWGLMGKTGDVECLGKTGEVKRGLILGKA